MAFTIRGSASFSAGASTNGGFTTNTPLPDKPTGTPRALLWPDFTLRLAYSQGLPARAAVFFSLRGRSCASGRATMGCQISAQPVAKRVSAKPSMSTTLP